jgi:hypothetical protein
MCKWLKKLFSGEGSNANQPNLSSALAQSYVKQFPIYEVGLSPKTIRHDDLARLLNCDAEQLHEMLLPPRCYQFPHYFAWDNGTWRLYFEGKFPLRMGMVEFVGIDASNIGYVKQLFEGDTAALQVLDNVEKALK